jgi:hypothetical protein
MHIVLQAVHEDSLGHYHLALPLYLLSIQHFQKAVNGNLPSRSRSRSPFSSLRLDT